MVVAVVVVVVAIFHRPFDYIFSYIRFQTRSNLDNPQAIYRTRHFKCGKLVSLKVLFEISIYVMLQI